jgi:hypothetical protein
MVLNLRRSQVDPDRDRLVIPKLLLVLLIAVALASCQSSQASTPDPDPASNSSNGEGDMDSVQDEDLTVEEESAEVSQCLFFAGDIKVESVDYTDNPCEPYQDCPDPNVEYATGMGGGDPVEGQGDCSQAPPYCFEQGKITKLVSYMQPGRPIPIKIRLDNTEDELQVKFQFDYKNNEDADMVEIHYYNYSAMDSFYLETLPWNDGFLEVEILYDQGVFELSGTLGEIDGDGTFAVSHPDLGDFITGSWTVICQE